MPISKEQAAHLNTRITAAFNDKRYPGPPKPPAAVLAAQKVIKDYDAKRKAEVDERNRKLTEQRTAAQEAVLTGDWPAALAAVRKFETAKV